MRFIIPSCVPVFVFLAGAFIQQAAAADAVVTVKPGDTLSQIVQRLFPVRRAERDLWQACIFQQNPDAFLNESVHELIVGQRLVIPESHNQGACPIPKSPAPTATTQPKKKPVAKAKPASTDVQHRLGKVVFVRGRAVAEIESGLKRLLKVGGQIFSGEEISTAVDSEVKIVTSDGGELHLRADSTLRVDEYFYQSKPSSEATPKTAAELATTVGSRSLMSLVRGGLRAITGTIGKKPNDRYGVESKAATIGIRGTDYVLRQCEPANPCENTDGDAAPNGIYAAVLDGAIRLSNEAGEASVKAGQVVRIADRKTEAVPASATDVPLFNPAELTQFQSLLPETEAPPDRFCRPGSRRGANGVRQTRRCE